VKPARAGFWSIVFVPAAMASAARDPRTLTFLDES
jgi:hypothetical protein